MKKEAAVAVPGMEAGAAATRAAGTGAAGTGTVAVVTWRGKQERRSRRRGCGSGNDRGVRKGDHGCIVCGGVVWMMVLVLVGGVLAVGASEALQTVAHGDAEPSAPSSRTEQLCRKVADSIDALATTDEDPQPLSPGVDVPALQEMWAAMCDAAHQQQQRHHEVEQLVKRDRRAEPSPTPGMLSNSSSQAPITPTTSTAAPVSGLSNALSTTTATAQAPSNENNNNNSDNSDNTTANVVCDGVVQSIVTNSFSVGNIASADGPVFVHPTAELGANLRLIFTADDAADPWTNDTVQGRLQSLVDDLQPCHLHCEGEVRPQVLHAVLNAIDWSRIVGLRIEDLSAPTFAMTSLDKFTSLANFQLVNGLIGTLTIHPGSHASESNYNYPTGPTTTVPSTAASTTSFSSDAHSTPTPRAAFVAAGTLQNIIIENMGLLALPQDFFRNMSRLVKLGISNNQLTEISGLRHLPALTHLRVQYNRLRALDPLAFSGNRRLREIDLSFNDITTLPPTLLQGAPDLRRFNVRSNPIYALPPELFSNNTQLAFLDLAHARLEALPRHLFDNSPGLRNLTLSRNRITSVPHDLFFGLSRLRDLVLSRNAITSIHADTFRDLTGVVNLRLNDNRLSSVPATLFASCKALEQITMQRNRFPTLPPGIFAAQANLKRLFLNDNRFTHVRREWLAPLTKLERLFLSHNRLTTVNLQLPQLTYLHLDNNDLTVQPDVSGLPELRVLQMNNHRLPRVDLTPFFRLTHLEVLELDAGRRTHLPTATFDSQDADAHNQGGGGGGGGGVLEELHMKGVQLSEEVLDTLVEHGLSLQSLSLGAPSMDERTAPMPTLCKLLAPKVEVFALSETGFQNVSLCAGLDFDAVFLQGNPRLRSLTARDALQQLNVSDCMQLTELTIVSAEVLDISRTRIPPTRAMCITWGSTFFRARDLLSDEFGSDLTTRNLIEACLDNAGVVDLSENAWLNNLAVVGPSASRITLLTTTTVYRPLDFSTALNTREAPPLVILDQMPITCSVVLLNTVVRPVARLEADSLSNQVGYYLNCQCSAAHTLSSSGRCHRVQPDIAAIVSGSIVGGIVLLAPLVVWYYRRYRTTRVSDDLHKQLLEERDEEVLALKKAWEIEYDELRFSKRIAGGSFGDVWKAEWDSVTVAVKVLQRAVMLFDESTLAEFEKEVEFLRRTRHPNVVRFFGAGTQPNGSPFLVLEFVAHGSLRGLLQSRKLEGILNGYKQRLQPGQARDATGDGNDDGAGQDAMLVHETEDAVVCSSAEGDAYDDSGSWHTLRHHHHKQQQQQQQHRERNAITGDTTLWGFKLQLVRDVISGMAFIHSLNQVHRDLKSGNVLVSGNLRAKITDFGTIRQCLETSNRGHGRTGSGSTTSIQGSIFGSTSTDPTAADAGDGLSLSDRLSMTAEIGTPMYMAPEVLGGGEYDAQADVFSFGVLLWEVATECVPDLLQQELGEHAGEVTAATLVPTLVSLLQAGKRLSFQEHNAAVPSWYQQLTRACVSTRPDARPTFASLKSMHELGWH